MKKRVLITIVGQGSITHIIRTGLAEKMRSFCDPIIAIQWNQVDLIAELREKKFEVHLFPDVKLSEEYYRLRAELNRWYFKKVLRSPSTKIQYDYLTQNVPLRKKLIKTITRSLQSFNHRFSPGYIKKLIASEEKMLAEESLYSNYKAWICSLNVQGFFTVTPFLYETEIIGRILNSEKINVIASIHSFDNVTKRGWPAFLFNHYIVWNKYNKEELQRISTSLDADDISITGAPQFDFHFDERFSMSKEEWLEELGLPNGKKIILYSGSPKDIFLNEPQYLKHLEEALRRGLINPDVIILFRSHPLDKTDRWKEYVGESEFIFYSNAQSWKEKSDFANVTPNDIKKFISTLRHTDIHINVCSTMTVDGSVFNKPQIGPYYDAIYPDKQGLLRKIYYQEHFLPIMRSNVISLAHSKDQLIDLVNKSLEHPEEYNKECMSCVKEIITYTDGQSTERVAAILKRFFS